MTPEEIRSAIEEALENLGEASGSVAEHLEKEGCKGIPKKADACPVQRYLRKHLNFPRFNIEVEHSHSYVWTEHEELAVARNPRAVRLFVKRFDRGAFPDLVEEGAEG